LHSQAVNLDTNLQSRAPLRSAKGDEEIKKQAANVLNQTNQEFFFRFEGSKLYTFNCVTKGACVYSFENMPSYVSGSEAFTILTSSSILLTGGLARGKTLSNCYEIETPEFESF